MAPITHIKTEEPGIIREIHSKALLATDKASLERHRVTLQKSEKIAKLTTTVESMEARLTEMSQMLSSALFMLEQQK